MLSYYGAITLHNISQADLKLMIALWLSSITGKVLKCVLCPGNVEVKEIAEPKDTVKDKTCVMLLNEKHEK